MALALKLTENDICRNEEELFSSRSFKRVLKLYNETQETSYTPDDIRTSFELASELDSFFQSLEVRAKVEVSDIIRDLRARILRNVRLRDTNRLLPNHELEDRLANMGQGLNLQQALRQSADFYGLKGFWKEGTYKSPEQLEDLVSEGKTDLLEKLTTKGLRPNVLFLDDGRFTDIETIDHLFEKVGTKKISNIKKLIASSRSLSPEQLEALRIQSETAKLKDILKNFQEAHKKAPYVNPNVQLFAALIQEHNDVRFAYNPAETFLDTIRGRKNTDDSPLTVNNRATIPTLGQFLRLSHFLRQVAPNLHKALHNRNLLDGPIILKTPLNHVLENGKILVVRGDLARSIYLEAVDPRAIVSEQNSLPLYLGK